jgi:copper chaperone CopZ
MTATLCLICPDIECEGCANAIKRSLGNVAGVQDVGVDVPNKSVTVAYDTGRTSDAALRARLAQAGFPPK